jgi:hypothetical protein
MACNTSPIKKNKMEDVMYDIMIVESGNQHKYNFGLLPREKWDKDYFIIAQRHDLDTQDLKKAFTYYSAHPKEFGQVMETVITRLQEKQLMPDSTIKP